MLFRTLIDTVVQNNIMPVDSHNIQNLQHAILKLSTLIDSNEAKYIATISFNYPLYLAKQNDLLRPALFHNTLINMNCKKRDFIIILHMIYF